MLKESKVQLKDSVGFKLLRLVFSIYIIVATAVTVVHMGIEYFNAKSSIKTDLQLYQTSFEDSLSVALWNLDSEQLEAILPGLLKLPSIVGIQILDLNRNIVARRGLIQELIQDPQNNSDLFWHTFPIVFTKKGENSQVGTGILYSSTDIVIQKVRIEFVLIIINSIIKTAALWIIFLWGSRLILVRPLTALTNSTREMTLDKLGKFKIDIKVKGYNEFKVLETAFNTMLDNLFQATKAVEERENQLKQVNKELEYRIENRTKDLKIAKELAEQSNKAKSQFLANMSHEIRTPMNSVIGFSELLASLITDKKQKKFIESIQTAGKSLLTLINDILDLSKVEAGMLEIQYEPTEFRMLIHEIEQIFKFKIQEKNLKFLVEIAPEFPKALMLDEVRIRQTLINLIDNAVKFTEKGHIKISITMKPTLEDHNKTNISISVKDTGIGILENQQRSIFGTFHQQDGQSTRKFGGTGLGLSLSKNLIELMGGTIGVESNLGQGSNFTISLREVAVLPDLSPTNKQKDTFDAEGIVFEPSRVLVVDDIESNRNLISELLTPKGLEILEADNGQKALIFAQEYHPKLILMDIRMPVMNGYEAIQLLRENPETNNIPVIALTASVSQSEKSMLGEFGFDGYLLKPINLGKLYEELFRYIKSEKKIPTEKNQPNEKTPAPPKAKNWVMPPELMESLENRYKEQWKIVKGDGVFGKIEDFGKQLHQLGEDYQIPPLSEFGKNLQFQTETFDIEGMNATLESYSSLIEELKNKV